jgi:hypothetical protein
MPDQTTIIKVQYDTAEAVANVDKLTTAISNNKARQVELKEELKNGKISQQDYANQMAKVTKSISNDTTERKKYIDVVGTEINTLKRAKVENAAMKVERDKLNTSTKEGRKHYDNLTQRIKENNKVISASSESTKTGGASLKNLLGSVIALGAGYLSFQTAAKLFNSIMASTDETADALEEQIQGVKNATSILFSTIASGDFTNLWSNMKKAYEIGKLYAGEQDDIENRTRELGIEEKKVRGEQLKLLKQLKAIDEDTGEKNLEYLTDKNERIVAGNKYMKIEFGLAEKRISIAQEALNSEVKLYKSKTANQNLSEQEILDITERYTANKPVIEQGKIYNKINDEYNALLLKQEGIKNGLARPWVLLSQQDLDKIQIFKKYIDTTSESVKHWGDIAKGTGKINEEELNKLAKLQENVYEAKNSYDENTLKVSGTIAKLVNAENKDIEKNSKIHETDLKNYFTETVNLAEQWKDAEKSKTETDKKRGESIWKLAELKQKALELEAKTEQEKRDAQITGADAAYLHEIKRKGIIDAEIQVADQVHKDALIEAEKTYQEAIKEQRQKALDEAFDGMQQIIEATSEMGDARVNIMADAFSRLATIDFAEVKTAKDAFIQIGQAAQGLTSLITAGRDQEMADIETKKNAELAAAGENATKKAEIEKKYNKKAAALKRAQFQEDKLKAIADSLIATTLAVIKAGILTPLGITTAILGAGMTTFIASRSAPKFTSDQVFSKGGVIAQGPTHAQGGINIWGDNGQYFGNIQGKEAMIALNTDATAEVAALSMINERHGGRSLTNGRTYKYLEEGGQMEPMNIERTVDEAMQRTTIVVRVSDIATGLTDVSKVKSAGVI